MATPIQTYYVPLREDDLNVDFVGINSGASGDINTLISIAIAAPGTIIWYDHWEDGYETEYTLSTSGSTEIWGDGVDGTGEAPGGLDAFLGGELIILENDVPVGRTIDPSDPNTFLFDGADRIVVSFPVAVTRAAFPDSPGSLLAGGVEVFATDRYGTSFTVPVGEDLNDGDGTDPSGTNPFERTSVHIMAAQDNTEVFFDGGSQTIDAGETILIENVEQGDEITSDKPVQATLVTGDVDSTYEMRWYALAPRDQWSNDYYTPVFTPDDDPNQDDATQVWVYNPNDSAITVTMATNVSPNAQSISIGAGSSALFDAIPAGSGARFTSSADFFALTQTDSDGSGQIKDWGHPLVPTSQLTSQALIGLGYGATNNNPNQSGFDGSRSVVWVTPVANAWINIDFNGDGTIDNSVQLGELSSLRILDDSSVFSGAEDDQDMSGAVIFATTQQNGAGDPIDIAVAWGQDPSRSFSGDDGGLDLGTVVPPLPVLTAEKDVEIVDDADGSGTLTPGDTVEWTITILNFGRVDLPENVYNIVDDSFGGTPFPLSDVFAISDYVANTTFYTFFENGLGNPATTTQIADASGFPLDGAGVLNGDEIEVLEAQTYTFQTTIKAFEDLPAGTDSITNQGALRTNTGDEIERFDASLPLEFQANIDIEKFTNNVDADDPADGPIIPVGAPVTWRYEVTNPNGVANGTHLANIDVTDNIAGVTPEAVLEADGGDGGDFNIGDVDKDDVLDPGETWIYEATGLATEGQYANTGTATGTPVYEDGTTVGGVDDPEDSDDSHYFGGVAMLALVKEGAYFDVGGDGLNPGDELRYTFKVTNTGDVTVTGVTINELSFDLPGDIVITPPGDIDLSPDEEQTWTGVYVLQQADIDSFAVDPDVDNTASATGFDPDDKPVDSNEDDAVIPFDPAPMLALVKEGAYFDVGGDGLNPGDELRYTFKVTNTGDVTVTGVTINELSFDLPGDIVITPPGDIDLSPDEEQTWTGVYVLQQADIDSFAVDPDVDNTASATGFDPDDKPVDSNEDDAVIPFRVTSGIDIEKATNGLDADTPTGPLLNVGSLATFTYSVTNTGDVSLGSIVVLDDNGTPGDTGDDFAPAPISDGGFNVGDLNDNGMLDPDETWQYEANRIVTKGQYTNVGSVTANGPDETEVEDDDPSNHFGTAPDLDIEKLTNGVQGDGGEDVAEIEAGDTVTSTYVLTNTGNVDVDEGDITVNDDQEGVITDIVDKGDGDGTLAPGEVWVYEKTGIAQDLRTVIDFETDLNGVPLAAGTFITDQFAAAGLNISATEFGAMIFDSANPTGGDFDLATPDLGNILIVSADGDQSDPDDNENGGTITLLWDEPVRFDSTLVLDIEEPDSTVVTYDAEGDLIKSTPIPQTGDGERQLINIGDELVSRIEYNFTGSGATVPEFVFTDIYRNEATVSIGEEVFDRDDSGYVNPAEKPEKKAIKVGIFDAETDTVVQTLTDGAVFSTADLAGDDLTFSAEALAGGPLDGEVGSMRLRLTGDGVNISRVENVTPYALFGDAKGDLRGGLELPEGEYVFTVSIYSGGGGKGELLDTCFFSFTVSDNPNTPPQAKDDDGFSTLEDTPLPIAAAALLGNDTDTDGDALTVTQAFGAVGGSVSFDGVVATFTPDVNYFGPASFKYEISDGNGGADVAEVEIDVTPVNDDPVAFEDLASTVPGVPINIAALANDYDPDGDPLSIQSATVDPLEGSAVIDGSQIRFTPAAGFEGVAEISYEISDGNGGFDDGVITVEVQEEQQPASIGDRVWLDENKNGAQDGGESGVAGVGVDLFDNTGGFIASTTTDGNGNYAFTDVDPGDYRIDIDIPAGFGITTLDPVVISLASGEDNDAVDFGLFKKDVPPEPVMLTKTVSFDGEQRGTKDFDTTQGGSDNDLEIGGGDQTGLVFEDVEIAAGAMITEATLVLTSQRKQGGGGTAEIEIRLFDDADGISSSGNGVLTDPGFDTFDFVEWYVSDQWFPGTVVETPDLSSLVQNLIDSDPQGDGSYDLAFAMDSLTGTRRIEAEEFGEDVAAKLNLTYEVDLV